MNPIATNRIATTTATLPMKLAGIGVIFLAIAACSKPSPNTLGDYSVQIAPANVTIEDYRNHRNVIELEPGNRNPKISWATLYDMMPGEEPVEDRKDDPSEITLKSVAKTFLGGKSTKKNFANWKDDPDALRAELDRRFSDRMRSYLKSKTAKAQIVEAAKAHGIDPILILACMVGENIFNVNGYDDIQTYAVKLELMKSKWTKRFASNKVDLAELLKKAEFEECEAPKRAGGLHADYWDCADRVWSKSFAGKPKEGGGTYHKTGFKWAFFDPIGTGYSYGPGQLDPIRALMVTDQVHLKSGFPLLTVESPGEIYEAILDPQKTFHYVAANVRLMIDRYQSIAGFDISKNPGIIASLYNLGREKKRAEELYRNNLISLKSGQLTRPLENYYGFYMNEKEAVMRTAFDRWAL